VAPNLGIVNSSVTRKACRCLGESEWSGLRERFLISLLLKVVPERNYPRISKGILLRQFHSVFFGLGDQDQIGMKPLDLKWVVGQE